MKTKHIFIKSDSQKINEIKSNSINLVVTSPPYPMVKMWDEIMLNKKSSDKALDEDFIFMNKILDNVWKEMYRVMKDGSLMVINVGDATRSNEKGFKVYMNSSKTIELCTKIGFEPLPRIIWSKPTNSPNKFLGSGMYPVLSYVTLEHEHIIIFRKGKNRVFSKVEMEKRRESAFFSEERNEWFCDVWNVRGTRQQIKGFSRERNASFPLEIPYRLISMFSIKGDTILDPFIGFGTTSLASASLERNSIGVDLMEDFVDASYKRLLKSKNEINEFNFKRLEKHKDFVRKNKISDDIKNEYHKFNVKTKWETNIKLKNIKSINKISDNEIEVEY